MSGKLAFLVHPEEGLREQVSAALHGAGFKVMTAATAAEAHQALESFRFLAPDVVLATLGALGEGLKAEGLDVVGRLRSHTLTREIPIVVLASGQEDERRQALRLGLPHRVPPPYDREEVVLATRLAVDSRRDERLLSGSLEQLPVPDLLQTAEAGRRSGRIAFRGRGRTGTVWLRDGRVVDAEIDAEIDAGIDAGAGTGAGKDKGRRGAEAVYEMVFWDEGTFEADFTAVQIPERISEPTSALLLEAMRLRDEELRSAAPPHAAMPDPPPPPPRPMLALHRSLTLLNVAASYACGQAEPTLVERRLEEARRLEAVDHPVLEAFRVSAGGTVAAPVPSAVIRAAGRAAGEEGAAALVRAVSRWLSRFFSIMERALPGRFALRKLRSVTEAVQEDLESLGFYRELGLEAGPRE